MNKKERFAQIASDNGITSSELKRIIDAVGIAFTEVLAEEKEFTLKGFGKFSVVHKPSREARNPSTGEKMMTKPKNVVKFKPSPKYTEKFQ